MYKCIGIYIGLEPKSDNGYGSSSREPIGREWKVT